VKKIVVLFFLFSAIVLHAQNESLLKPGRVIFYNVENLFDTINDPETQDEEFLPSSKNEWNTKKYQVKLNHVAKVFAAMLDTIQPLVIGMTEIENKNVLEDLIAQPALKKFNFGIIHHDSPDERGIDAAILYNKDVVESIFDATLKVDLGNGDKTRDILYFKAQMSEEFPVWFFVNHWPSRRGGGESEEKRKIAAKVMRSKIENIFLGEPFARIIVMGDFNDNPGDASVRLLSPQPEKKSKTLAMVNLMLPLADHKEFTLKYKDESDIFDQFIVSVNLLDPRHQYYIRKTEARIFTPSWLLFKHPKFGLIPNRTYANGKWVGGYSDHLPVYFDLLFNTN